MERANFNALITALKTKFKPAQLSDLRSVELHSRSQGPKESVADFAQAIQKLMKQAYPEVADEARRQLMKRFFLNGLHHDLRRLVLISKPATFEEAETQARAQEASDHVVFGSAPYLNKNKASTSSCSVKTEEVMDLNAMKEAVDRLERKIEASERRVSSQNFRGCSFSSGWGRAGFQNR